MQENIQNVNLTEKETIQTEIEPEKIPVGKKRPRRDGSGRITTIGGQAVMEGIMMRGPKETKLALRLSGGEIEMIDLQPICLRDKCAIWKWPLLRGIAGIVDSLSLGYKALSISTDKMDLGEEEEEPSKFDAWLEKHFGDKITNIIMGIGMVLGVALAIVLFFLLPTLAWNGVIALSGEAAVPMLNSWRPVAEGIMRIVIFVLYIYFCAKVPYMKRVFQYHGAEHKTIFCYEDNEELTVENVRQYRRFHPRCGTSFMVVILLLGVILGFFIPFTNPLLRTAVKLLCIPVVVAVGYELIRFCGKHDNWFTRVVSAPGTWMQHITTQEPDDAMIEVAIAALKEVVPENGEDLVR